MGETFTVADCYLFTMLRWCDRFDLGCHLLDDYFHRIHALAVALSATYRNVEVARRRR